MKTVLTKQKSFWFAKFLAERIRRKMVNAVKSMHTIDRAYLKYNNSKTNPIISDMWVKEGDPTSSPMFKLFVNDITYNVYYNLEGIFSVN